MAKIDLLKVRKVLLNDRGMALMLVIAVISVVTIMAGANLVTSFFGAASGDGAISQTAAFYIAKAGLSVARSTLLNNIKWRNATTDSIQFNNIEFGRGVVDVDSVTMNVVGTDTILILIARGYVPNEAAPSVVRILREVVRIIPVQIDTNKAVAVGGTLSNVNVRDEDGNLDPSLISTGSSPLSDIDLNVYKAMSDAQGHTQTGDFTVSGAYPPNASFYFSGNTPNVTWIAGNLYVGGGKTIYGIVVVNGTNAVFNGSARMEGLLILPTTGSTVIKGGGDPGDDTIVGGVIGNGDLYGSGSHADVQMKKEYLIEFNRTVITTTSKARSVQIVSWEEL